MKNIILLVCIVGATACKTRLPLGPMGPDCPLETRPATASEKVSVRSQLELLDGDWRINWAERDASVFALSLPAAPEVLVFEGQASDGVECGAAFQYYSVEPASMTIQADWMTTVDVSSWRVLFTEVDGPVFDGWVVVDDLDASFFDSQSQAASVEQARLGFGPPNSAGAGGTVVLDGRFTEGELSVTRALARCDESCIVPANSN